MIVFIVQMYRTTFKIGYEDVWRKDLPHTTRNKLQETKQGDDTFEDFADTILDLTADCHPGGTEETRQTFAIDGFFKDCEDKKAALTATEKNQIFYILKEDI